MRFEIPRKENPLWEESIDGMKRAFCASEEDLLAAARKAFPDVLGIKVVVSGDGFASDKGVERGSLTFTLVARMDGGARTLSWFSLTEFPGCCGICIVTKSGVAFRFRGLGIATILHTVKERLARDVFGYSLLVATDVENNEPERKLLAKTRFEEVAKFTNERTSNVVCIHVKRLRSSR